MNIPLRLFDFPSTEHPAIVVARHLADGLASGTAITRKSVSDRFVAVTGSSDADNRWSVRDMNIAVELAQLLWLRDHGRVHVKDTTETAFAAFETLARLVPAQHNRSEEQIELQQFSTPLALSWIAARAAAIRSEDVVLEPSAGTGMLAIWPQTLGAKIILNEIAPLRRECLHALFPKLSVTIHDGELIDELLDPSLLPSVVLINPPFSVGLERGHDGRTGARHVRSAFRRLRVGGRLVAIMPEWFDASDFKSSLNEPLSIRLNITIDRAFARQGTGITTRLIVIDKTVCDKVPLTGMAASLCDLAARVDQLVPRLQLQGIGAPRTMPKPLGLRLVTAGTPLRPALPARPKAVGTTRGELLAFKPLVTPAPILPQIGHYLPYRPSRIEIEGAALHPTPLVESVAMGSIAAPIPHVRPLLPSSALEKGVLSQAQLETLVYAVGAFSRDLPGRYLSEDKGCSLAANEQGHVYRTGFFLGDGTGAGKGRQVASIILDAWLNGVKRHIWLSKNEALLEDARRDWAALGGLSLDIQPLSQWKLGRPVAMDQGILFVTYPTLRSGRGDATRLDQILAWAGDEFEGVIAFDEAHAMANAAGGEGSRGKVKGSEQGIAGVRLQNLLPRARVLYASATGASDVNNLAYATRLGLWGPQTAFATREKFVADIRAGGIAAMELVARDLKSMGLYIARALSFAGVEYDVLEHELTDAQIAVYDAYAQAWAIIHGNLREALEATRIVDEDSGDTLNSGAKSAALSVFEGTKQRFFAQLLLSMKLPSLLPAIQTSLNDGQAVVVQLVSTAEAMLNRRLADLTPQEREHLDIDLSPREYVVDYLMKSFPVRLMQVFTDENGDPRSEPMSDGDGNPVLCRRALEARDRMVEQLCALPPIATALDAIIERFGVDKVAEVTGRTKRLIIGADGVQKLQSRTPRANLLETQAFMDGDKRILVFSDAGGTGRSYHADLGAKNQARRVHFLLEPGWRADAAIQGLGRTNRTNQASAPLFRPVTTNVKGERRFISTIARRLDTLGALTRGQRQTGGQNLFDPADNLESQYAKDALTSWFGLLYAGKLDAVALSRFEELSGLRIAAKDGGMVDDLPPIQRWLNRILAFPIGLQNAIFDEYLGLVEARVDAARQAGTLDLGVETLPVESFDILEDRIIRTDEASGATTHLLEIEIARALHPLSFDRLMSIHGTTGRNWKALKNERSGRVALMIPARRLLTDEGERIDRFELIRPLKRDYLTADQLAESHWEPIHVESFEKLWNAEAEDVARSLKRERLHLATGLLLPVWDKLPDECVRVTRIAAQDGASLLGREIPAVYIPDLAEALGLNIEASVPVEGLSNLVLKTGKAMPVKGPEPLTLKRSLVNGSQRMELTGWSHERLNWYKAQGCFTEIIRYQTRLFVPLNEGSVVLARIGIS